MYEIHTHVANLTITCHQKGKVIDDDNDELKVSANPK